jgi:WD40 repeat protein
MPAAGTQLSAAGLQLVTKSGSLLQSWSLPGKALPSGNAPPDFGDDQAALAEAAPTALALDRSSDLLAVGLASGQLQLTSADGRSRAPLAFFGHRGPITAVALNGARGVAATGGNDGIVRVWDVATAAPTVAVMQPSGTAIASVALSADGQHVASAAERIVRVATTADGRVVTEVQAGGAVNALTFAPDGLTIAVADATGGVIVAPLGPGRRTTARLAGAAVALAFAPDGSRLAVADASGAITLLNPASGEDESEARSWAQPIRWLEYSPDGSTLFVATDAWLHSLAATTPALAPLQSKLVSWPAGAAVATTISASAVALAGVAVDGSLTSGVIDLEAIEPVADATALVARDWQAALALRLNDNGESVPIDP